VLNPSQSECLVAVRDGGEHSVNLSLSEKTERTGVGGDDGDLDVGRLEVGADALLQRADCNLERLETQAMAKHKRNKARQRV